MAGKKPYLAVVIIHVIYAGMFLISKVAFDVGMNTFVFVFYRQAAAALFLSPIAMFFEWKTSPPFSFMIFIKIFFLSLFGITMTLDIYAVALKYTSASLAASTSNSLPVITFFLALIFRVEKVNLRTRSGISKLTGVALCMAGVVTIAFYKGPYLKLLMHHHLISYHSQEAHHHVHSTGSTWMKGVLFMLLSNACWGLWLILQGRVLESYPSKLLCTTLQCIFSAFQSFFIAIAVERNPYEWKLGWNIRLLSVAYCGIMVTGITFYLQAWIVEKKGPVFLAMMTPLVLVFTVLSSAFFLGEMVSLGSVLGTLLLVGGLYCVLCGQAKEQKREQGDSASTSDLPKVCLDDEERTMESTPA